MKPGAVHLPAYALRRLAHDRRATRLLAAAQSLNGRGRRSPSPTGRDITRRYLSPALEAGETLPRSSGELLSRLDRLVAEAPAELQHEAASMHARFEGLFDSFPGELVGGWSFPDYRAGHVLLKGMSNRD